MLLYIIYIIWKKLKENEKCIYNLWIVGRFFFQMKPKHWPNLANQKNIRFQREKKMCKDMDRQSPGESHTSWEPHENSPQKEPDKTEQHRQKGPIVSNTAQLTCLKMSLPERAVIQCQRMETQYNGFEKRSHRNDSNSHIQTLDSGGGGEGCKWA